MLHLICRTSAYGSQIFNIYDTKEIAGHEFWHAKHVEVTEKPKANKSGWIRPRCFEKLPFLNLERMFSTPET